MCADFVEGCHVVDRDIVRGCGGGIDAYVSDGSIVLCPHTTHISEPETVKKVVKPQTKSLPDPIGHPVKYVGLKSSCAVKYQVKLRTFQGPTSGREHPLEILVLQRSY